MRPVDVTAVEALVRPVLTGLGYDLVDLQWQHEGGRWMLRAYIDRDEAEGAVVRAGVDHEDCKRASVGIAAELDVADIIHVPYTLEVSSPGLDRPLKRERDFIRYTGQKAKIRTRRPIVEARRNFTGQLLGVDGGKVRIDVDGQVFEIPVDDVEKANLQFEISKGD